jgi:hypothetical protein
MTSKTNTMDKTTKRVRKEPKDKEKLMAIKNN